MMTMIVMMMILKPKIYKKWNVLYIEKIKQKNRKITNELPSYKKKHTHTDTLIQV